MTARYDHAGPVCTGVDCKHPDHAVDGESGEIVVLYWETRMAVTTEDLKRAEQTGRLEALALLNPDRVARKGGEE